MAAASDEWETASSASDTGGEDLSLRETMESARELMREGSTEDALLVFGHALQMAIEEQVRPSTCQPPSVFVASAPRSGVAPISHLVAPDGLGAEQR
jgi:hypothetical protein